MLKYSICVLLALFSSLSAFSQTEEEIKVDAEKFFENEEYVPATSLYLRLLSLHPKDPDYNFRYGTCLLFNSYKKQEAIRYLNFAVNEAGIDPRAFYFHGRALHLNYQFEDAKKSYQKYLDKREKIDKRYDAERQMQMCDNGKRLLATFTDIVVTEKKEIESEKFFRLYSNLETIGGTILVSADFQSKMDKKMGHVPIVHFPPNAKAIYYSSYGDNGENGKDIYIRRRLPDNSWGNPQLLPGEVNTVEDEDFPYMHPSGEYLYFSSKGHNSMGGYDVLYALYNPNTQSFGRPENVDFAISSPDDDLFYVVDSLHQSAYFASARQSQNGKLHVYQVKVARVPIQEVIIMGDYLSEINPENKEMNIRVTSHTNGQEIGKIKSDAKGKYSFVFPKGGKYNYEVRIADKEDIYKFVVEVPFLEEFRPLKQKAVHKLNGDQEIVQIVNLFDEKVEGAEALIAEVIRKRAELEVNVGNFNTEPITDLSERDKILAQVGFKDMGVTEISAQLEDMTINEQLKIEQVKRVEDNMNTEIVREAEKLEVLDQNIAAARQELEESTDPTKQHELLEEIKRIEGEKAHVSSSIAGLIEAKDQAVNSVLKPSESGIGKMEIIENQFNALMAGNKEDEAMKLLLRNKDIINKSRSESPEAVVNSMVETSLKLQEEIAKLSQKEKDLELDQRRLESEIRTLKAQLIAANKKDADLIQDAIKMKEGELPLVREVLAKTRAELSQKNKELNVVDENIATLQKALVADPETPVSIAELKQAENEAKQAQADLALSTTEEELDQLEIAHPELDPDFAPSQEDYTSIQADLISSEQNLEENTNLSETEKNNQRLENNQTALAAIDERIEVLNKEDGQGMSPAEVSEEKKRLEALKAELTKNNEALRSDQVLTSQAEDLQNDHEARTSEVKQLTNLPASEQNKRLIEENTSTIAAVKERIAVLDQAGNPRGTQAEKTQLEALRTRLEEENKVLKVNTNQLVAVDVQKEYDAALSVVNDKPNLTEAERLGEKINTAEVILSTVGKRLEELEQALEQGTNASFKKELEELEAIRDNLLGDQQKWQQEIEALGDPEVDVALSLEDVLREISPTYQDQVDAIRNNQNLTERERLTQLQAQNEDLVTNLIRESEDLNTKLEGDPENSEWLARADIIAAIKEEKQAELEQVKTALDRLPVEVPTLSDAEIRAAIIAQVDPVKDEDRVAARQPNASPFDQERAVLELEVAYLNELRAKQEEANTAAAANPNDAEVQKRIEVLNELVETQEVAVSRQKEAAVALISSEQIAVQVERVDRRYGVEIGELEQSTAVTRNTDIADRESELQELLKEEIASKQEELNRRYSVTAELEVLTLERALEASAGREANARNADPVAVETPENRVDYVQELRTATLGEGENPVTANYTSKDQLNTQDQLLAFYETSLSEQIAAGREQLDANPGDVRTEQRVTWMEEELEQVRIKRRQISVTLGELDTQVVENPTVNKQGDPELLRLNEKENALLADLNDPSLSADERKEVQQELDETQAAQLTRENEIFSIAVVDQQKEDSNLSETFAQYSNDTRPEVQQQAGILQAENQSIQAQIEAAEQANTPEERNYLLERAAERQERLNDQLNEQITEEKQRSIEQKEQVVLVSREQLEQSRRSFSVQIGELNTELIRVDREIETARKKDLPALQTQREALVAERAVLELQLQEVEERLATWPVKEETVAESALELEISFNEERSTASGEEYENYFKLANEALEVEQQIAKLETELKGEQDAVNALLSDPMVQTDDEGIQLRVRRIKELQVEMDGLSIDLVQRRYAAEQVLPSDKEEAMKMQNLVLRGIQPIKTAVIATALLQMPNNGLAINENVPSPYTATNPIPVDVKNPSGLYYRVQVGAFAKPIPQDLFKQFVPVSGEKINGTNITRYMAGFFNNSTTVVDARDQIRALGYADAFVVAYCDGERIQFADARQRELNGTCVAKGSNELMMEVAVNTAEKLGLPLTTEVKEVPEYSYNNVPGASKADPIEMKQGLFYTVQIGVFNRVVGPAFTYGMEELLTVRLPNGQIRYASGMFNSVEEAMPRRQKALDSGVTGAFVTAYYKGERITLAEAARLLQENGRSILQTEIEKSVPPVVVVDPPVVITPRADTAAVVSALPVEVEQVEQFVQIVSRNQYEEFPRDVLNRYNAEGNFYYDASDKRVKSVVYDNVDDLPRLWNFRNDIDTVYYALDDMAQDSTRILEINFGVAAAPGDFIDWLMRFNYRKEFVNDGTGMKLKIFGIEPNKVSEVQGIVRKFGLEAKEAAKNEFELQIEER